MNLWRRAIAALAKFRPVIERIFLSQRQAGVLVNEDTALTNTGFWACVSLLSRTVAALPWHVYEWSPQGRKPVDGTVSWLLNNQPNPEMTAFSFREALMVHVLTWGNAYAEIVKDLSGRVVQLWLLLPDRVIIRRGDEGELLYTVHSETGRVELTADRVLHLHGLGFDGICGYSIVHMARRSIGVGIAQDVFAANFYSNGTVMGTVIEMPGSMSPAQIAEHEDYHNDKNKGVHKAFRVKVAPAGMKIHSLTMPMTDAQFLESRKFSITEAARWFGIPPHKIADLDRSTNNNIEHQGIEFVTDAIVPWTVRLEQEANIKLFGARAQGRVYTKLMVQALMRGDAKSRGEFYRLMIQMGVMSINEVRELEDLNDIGPAGDQHLVQLNQTTLEWLVENPGRRAATPTGAPAGAPGANPPAADAQPAPPSNVIRAQALEFLRQQRKQA